MMVYCQSKLPRAGLGNKLFPWARCRIFSKVHNLPMLWPRWWQIKLGPLLRRESDKRIYSSLFVNNGKYVGGIEKLGVLCFAKRIKEQPSFAGIQDLRTLKKGIALIQFSGEKNYFKDLIGYNDFIYRELIDITRGRWLKEVELGFPPIGIHVRCGDFMENKTPIKWFVDSLKSIREHLGCHVGAFVSSDGSEKELKPILDLDNVSLIRSSAITQLLILSKAKILIASGMSTFSAWASFLGQMPTIYHPQRNLSDILPNNKDFYVGECNPDFPPNDFLAQARDILRAFCI